MIAGYDPNEIIDNVVPRIYNMLRHFKTIIGKQNLGTIQRQEDRFCAQITEELKIMVFNNNLHIRETNVEAFITLHTG